jgi:hypothetical protein
MSRKKLERVLDLEKAKTRLAALKSISADLDLGNGITVPFYQDEISQYEKTVELYNTTLSTIDDLYNECIAQKIVMRDWNERVLTGVATKYGKNSSQYEMAGGVKKSERKKANSKTKKQL